METPEQQRRSTIGQFAEILKGSGLEINAVDVADMLWLAGCIELDTTTESEDFPLRPPKPRRFYLDKKVLKQLDKQGLGRTTNEVPTDWSDPDDDLEEPTLSVYADPPPTDSESEDPQQPEPGGMTFPVPAAPAIRTRLDLARSLRPLMRKVPSPARADLDEEATVNRIAAMREAGMEICVPVVRPTPERWLDLDLVVESSKTTVLWERAIAELHHLLEYQGAFRTVRTWRLEAEGRSVRLFPRWNDRPENRINRRPRSIKELVQPSGRRLVLYVSDCTSPLWRRGIVHETLWEWSKGQPLALVQMFPERLWSRTALADGYIVRLSSPLPGAPNSRLHADGLPDLGGWDALDESEPEDSRLLTLPVVTLDPEAFRTWARVVAGVGESRTPGRVFELAFVGEMADEPGVSPPQTPKQRVELFRATASRTARQLAGLMAATPVSLPVIDLLRDEFLPEARQEHVAEVLLSGLLRRCDPEDEGVVCRYEFYDGVRDLLVDGVPVPKTMSVLDRLSERISRQAGCTLKDFLALLQDPECPLGESALPFARIGLGVLRRLGGSYAEFAESVAPKIFRSEPPASATSGEVSPEPEKRIETFDVAFIKVEETAEFEFDLATVERQEKRQLFGLRRTQEWVITKQRRRKVAILEDLGGGVQLELVEIPAGTFQMGSPEDEPERSDWEGPQHEVSVPAFLMGKYPVTQAQWKAIVTRVPRIRRELDPDPSNFKGGDRPVEKVSWYDAVEFCARLSKYTGETYRLPSEAEWEYACRAGTTTPFHFGETLTTELANYDGNQTYNDGPKGERRGETTPVGHFGVANAFGLYDMHGNVREWCADPWHDNYEGAPEDGRVWDEANNDNRYQSYGDEELVNLLADDRRRVNRGGSWGGSPWFCRCANHHFFIFADDRIDLIGFRVLRSPPRT